MNKGIIMNKGLEIIESVDMFCLFVSAIVFFTSWLINGTKSSLTVASGMAMFVTMFAWFFIEALTIIVHNIIDMD